MLFAAELPSNPTLFGRALDQLGTGRGLELSSDRPGVFATTTVDPGGGRLLHLLNTSGYRCVADVVLDGTPVGGGALELRPYSGWMLPMGIRVGEGRVDSRLWANAELASVEHAGVSGIRLAFTDPVPSASHRGSCARIRTWAQVSCPGGQVTRMGDVVEVTHPARMLITLT